ncbi:cytochrome c oxidase accessory protein CcoG, partial [Methylophaga sp. SB9B]
DCKLCVNVCPTGIDIRKGQQEGCITCGLCIDACDSVMDKINEPRGLIRYASYAELQGHSKPQALYKRPRVIIYTLILLASLAGIV